MYVLIQKRNERIVHHIPITLTILTAIVLIYLFHISIAKLFFDFCSFKHVFKDIKKERKEEIKKLNNSVTFIRVQKRDDGLFKKAIMYQRFCNKESKGAARSVGSLMGRYPIVPNYVHYLRLNEPEFTFTHAISILSVYRNHVPNRIYIHTSNSSLSGPFWDNIRETRGLRLILKVILVNISNYITEMDKNMNLSFTYNFLKLKILEQYGGMILNKDMFIIKNLDHYLHHEMTLHWNRKIDIISDQIIIAKKNSIYLKKWIKGYRFQCLSASLMPFQYITYIIGKSSRSVFVESLQFIINYSMMNRIYGALHFNWHKKDVVWLMEDLTTPKVRSKVELYALEFIISKKMKTTNGHSEQNSNEAYDFSELEESQECVFWQMVKDVYY